MALAHSARIHVEGTDVDALRVIVRAWMCSNRMGPLDGTFKISNIFNSFPRVRVDTLYNPLIV